MAAFILSMALFATGVNADSEAKDPAVLRFQAFDLPLSSLLTQDERTILEQRAARPVGMDATCRRPRPPYEDVALSRKCLEDVVRPNVAKLREKYSVQVEDRTIRGIHVEIITPTDGVSPENRHRVLLNLHGGAFLVGARYFGQAESIPLAALARIKVVVVDYRMGPEHKFPAATEDAAAVYEALLSEYKAENIGIYGCSAGALLTSQTVAWLQAKRVPLPGAIGLFCGGATAWVEGDSAHISAAANGGSLASVAFYKHPYFKDTRLNDPLAFPAKSEEVMSKFPPSLLIGGIREGPLSSIVYTHSVLVKNGVEADLYIWEGLGHGEMFNMDLPQSNDALRIIAKFFARHLGSEQVSAGRQ